MLYFLETGKVEFNRRDSCSSIAHKYSCFAVCILQNLHLRKFQVSRSNESFLSEESEGSEMAVL